MAIDPEKLDRFYGGVLGALYHADIGLDITLGQFKEMSKEYGLSIEAMLEFFSVLRELEGGAFVVFIRPSTENLPDETVIVKLDATKLVKRAPESHLVIDKMVVSKG